MLRHHFRPWGRLDWVLSKLPKRSWSVLGCLATEDRCLTTWNVLHQLGTFGPSLFVEVTEQHSRFLDLANMMKTHTIQAIEHIGVPSGGIRVHPLLDTHQNIIATVDHFLGITGKDVIVDISCFPKRFFFPFIRRILAATSIENLLMTYTVPERYYEGILAEDHRSLANLPLFGIETFPEPKTEVAVISIGFVPLGITELVNPDRQDVEFKLLFPFPPGPPNFQRNWKFVAQLAQTLPLRSEPIRVEAFNVPDTFDHIVGLTSHGSRPAVFAPYGPKPMSLAMCLFAILAGSPVYYTQPQTYHPRYSTGVQQIAGSALSYAYCLRLNGHNLYSLG